MSMSVDGDIVLSVGLDSGTVINTAEQLEDDIKQIFSRADGKETSTAFKSLQLAMSQTVAKSNVLIQQLNTLASTTFPTDAYSEATKNLEKVEAQYAKLNDKRRQLESAGKIGTAQYTAVEQKLQSLYDTADNLRTLMQTMEQNGTAFINGEDTEEYQRLTEQLNDLNNRLVILKQRASEFEGESGGFRSSILSLIPNVLRLGTACTGTANRINVLGSLLSKLRSASLAVINTIKQLFISLKKLVSSSISNGIEKLRSKFSGLGKSSDLTEKSLKRGFKTLIKYVFGVRSFFFLYRKIRSAVSEGFGDLAQVYAPFNEAMSSIMTSLKLLKNTLAAAFAPIIETVAPALTTFINLVAKAVATVGQFIAALTGKEYVQAASIAVDYASSVDKSTKSTNKATSATKQQTKAQKELNREITHFDDLVILHEKNDTDDTPDTSSVTTPELAFKPVPVDDAINSFAKDFLAALSDWDFTEIGRKLNEKLSEMLESIDWESIYQTASNFGKGLATFLNGLISPRLFEDIGITIASALNTALHFLDTFGNTFDWSNFGKSLGAGLAALFETWDADLTADVFSTFVNGLATTIQSALEDFPATDVGDKISGAINKGLGDIDWENKVFPAADTFGTKLAEFLNGLIDEDTFATLGETVGNSINTALQILGSFGLTFEWDEFGSSLGTGLATFFETWDADLTADVFSTFVNGVASSIKSALSDFPAESVGTKISGAVKRGLKQIKWKEEVFPAVSNFGKKLAEFLNGLFEPDTFSAIGGTVANLLNSALQLLNNFGTTFDFAEFGTSLASGINGFLDNFDTNELSTGVTTFVTGLRDAIISFIGGINWFEFGATVRDIIKNLPWKVLFVGVGMVIWEALNAIIEFFKRLFDPGTISSPIVEALEGLQEKINTLSEQVNFDTLIEGFGNLVEALKPAGEGFAKGLIKAFETFFEFGIGFFNDLGPALSDIATAISNLDPALLTSIGFALGIFVGALVLFKGISTVANIVQGLVSPFSGLLGVLTEHPIIAIAGSLVLLGGAMASMIDEGFFSDDDTQKAIQNANATIDSAQEVRREVQATLDEVEGKNRDREALFGVLEDLATEYFELKGKVNKTKTEQEQLNTLQDTLAEKLPGFNDIIGDTSLSYDDQKNAVSDLITETKDYYKTLAAQEYLQQYYKQLFDIEMELKKNEQAQKDVLDKADIWEQKGWFFIDPFINLHNVVEGSIPKLQDLGREQGELLTKQGEVKSAIEAAESVLQEYGGATESVTQKSSELTAASEEVSKSTKDVAKEAGKAKKDTSDFGKAFNVFDGLSIATPLKIALLTGAIKALGERGVLSTEDVDKLQSKLDNYDASPTEKNMEKVQTAFEKTGISADEFMQGLTTAMLTMDKATQEEIGKAVKTIEDAAPNLKSTSKTTFENVGEGGKEGLENKKQDVKDAGKSVVEETFNEMDNAAQTGSPSKRAEELGQNIDEGLKLGIEAEQENLKQLANTVISDMFTTMEEYLYSFETLGTDLMTNLNNGVSDMSYTLNSTAYDIVQGMYDEANSLDFWGVGKNIAVGIKEGLADHGEWLNTIAWNTAVGMYNSACDALDIESPSKKFAWIGEMVVTGLGNGIEDNEDIAVGNVKDMVSSMIDEAEDADVTVDIGTSAEGWVESLDEVLTKFSNTVVDKFDGFITNLQRLSTVSSSLPSVAQGKVIPMAVNTNQQVETSDTMKRMLEELAVNQITSGDLRQMLIDMFQNYMNLQWYIGDEQIARHANNGNVQLNRRYV